MVRIKGSRIVAKRGNRYLTRNSSFFKKVTSNADINNSDDSMDDDDDEDNDEYGTKRDDNVNIQVHRRSSRF